MKIKIKYLNCIRFKRFIINSAQRINQMEQYLNDINVFPVADGDTGTNMVMTMTSIVQGVKECKESSFAEISSVIANSALTGARGNSGAILAQFFQGLAEATRGKVVSQQRLLLMLLLRQQNKQEMQFLIPKRELLLQ
ncbi:MAG: DAK2 domain-containing protein [Candidatus Atribacteria bacterium]